MANKAAQELEEKIKAAFASNPYPGDDKIVDNLSGEDLESLEIAKVFRGQKWENVPLPILAYHYSSIYLFSPEGYHYYLPAFMLASLLHYNAVDMVPHSVIFSLTAPKTNKKNLQLMEWFRKRVEGFTPTQKTVIRGFLEYMESEHGSDFSDHLPRIALKRYWGNV